MDPTADITLDELVKGINVGRAGSFHPGGCNVALFDGSVRFISETIDKAILRALGDPRDGKAVMVP
jgi:prepilin-type processing-associated H-X9-DG protein